MYCYILIILLLLLLLTLFIKREWFAILAFFLLIGFVIIWALASLVPLGGPKPSLFEKKSYIGCYTKIKICGQQIIQKAQNKF